MTNARRWREIAEAGSILDENTGAVLSKNQHSGLFTGKKLSDFFNEQINDPISARTIINGHDRAEEIAALYKSFLVALTASTDPVRAAA